MKSTRKIFLLAGLMIVLAGCVDTRTPVDKAAAKIDDFLRTVNWNSQQWQSLVANLGNELETIEARAAQDVKDIAAKSIATGGQEIKCTIDFMRNRAKQDLQRLVDKLRGKPTALPLPEFCGVVPTGIDMANRPAFLEFYGYDFKVRDRDLTTNTYNEIKQAHAFLVYDGGEVTLDQWTDFPTHYVMTIKTSPSDSMPLCNKENRRIVLRTAAGAELSSVGVAKASCPAPPPPPSPLPEKQFYQVVEPYFSSSPFGFKGDKDFGGACSVGYHRSRYLITEEKKHGAGCNFVDWIGDEHMCKLKVHLWTDGFGGVDCRIEIYEIGDQQPAPPPPPCTCQ